MTYTFKLLHPVPGTRNMWEMPAIIVTSTKKTKSKARDLRKSERGLSRKIKAPWHQQLPELMAEILQRQGDQHCQIWLMGGQERENLKATPAELSGWSHTKRRSAKRMWIGSQAQPQKIMKKDQKEQSLWILVPLFSCYQRIFYIVFKTQFERALDMFNKKKKLIADMTISHEFLLPTTTRVIS